MKPMASNNMSGLTMFFMLSSVRRMKSQAAGMVVCCALPGLILSGGLGAVMAWLFDGSGIFLLVAGALALAAGGLFLATRLPGGHPVPRGPGSETRPTVFK